MQPSSKHPRNAYLQPANVRMSNSLRRTPPLPDLDDFEELQSPSSTLLSELGAVEMFQTPESPTPSGTLRRNTASDTPGPSFAELIGTEIVHFLIGPQRIELTAHKNLVCNASTILKRMLDSNARRDEYFLDSNELFLPESAHLAVRDFITLLYRDRKEVVALSHSRSYKDYVELYLFGSKFGVNTLMDIAIDGIQDQLRETRKSLTNEDIENIFANTARDDQLRRFCAALITHELLRHKNRTPSEVHALMVKVPDLLKQYLIYQHTESPEPPTVPTYHNMGNDPRDRVRDRVSGHGFHVCAFHVHDMLEECLTAPNC